MRYAGEATVGTAALQELWSTRVDVSSCICVLAMKTTGKPLYPRDALVPESILKTTHVPGAGERICHN
jgi:hypothetical protein